MKKTSFVCALALLAARALGGHEFQVNQQTVQQQQAPDVAMAPDGGFVVVWHSDVVSGMTETFSIYGRKFDATGAPKGDEFLVTETDPSPSAPFAAMDAAGNFVVTWGSGADAEDIHARRFNAQGEPVSDEFVVNSQVRGKQMEPAIGMNDAGDFVIAWRSLDDPRYEGSVSFGRAFRADGTPRGDEFLISNAATVWGYPRLAMQANGDFSVLWSRSGQGTYPPLGNHTHLSRFDAEGVPMGQPIELTPAGQIDVKIDRDGNETVLWANNRPIQHKRFRPDGGELTAAVELDLADPQNHNSPFEIGTAMADDGRLFLTFTYGSSAPYTESLGDGDGYGVFGCWLRADGAPLGPVMRINDTFLSAQMTSACAVSPDGRHAVAVWQSFGQDSSSFLETKSWASNK